MKRKRRILCLLLVIGCITTTFLGCEKETKGESQEIFTSRSGTALQEKSKTQTDDAKEKENFVIQENDMLQEAITLVSLEDGRQLRYQYSLSTKFLDSYGTTLSSWNFIPGSVVKIGKLNRYSKLDLIQMSSDVWKQTDVTKYKIDLERGMFTVGKTPYKITPFTLVYSGFHPVGLDQIGTSDTLQIIGQDKEIISVVVTTGHGTIKLVNTQLFVDSLICIGDKIFTMITGDMEIVVPEGTYQVTVANQGYGGTTEVAVPRDEVVELNLDTLKGEGPKQCELTFLVTIPDVIVLLDQQQIDITQSVKVAYGKHSLSVSAPGYENWTKTLFVNSPSAQIVLELNQESDQSTESSNNTSSHQENQTTNRNSNSQSTDKDEESNDATNNSTTKKSSEDLEVDYLTTLTDLLTGLSD